MLRRVDNEEDKEKDSDADSPTNDEFSKEVPWYHIVLLNPLPKFLIVLLIASIIAPVLIFFFLYQNIYINTYNYDGYSIGICSHSKDHRIPCSVKTKVSYDSCSKYCCYDEENKFCYHSVPSRYNYISEGRWQEGQDLKPRIKENPYNSLPNKNVLGLHINEISNTHLNFEIYDVSKKKLPRYGSKAMNISFEYKVFYPELFFEINSKDKNITKPLLSTSRGPMFASKDIWEWNFHISDDHVYGMEDYSLNSNVMYNTEKKSHSMAFIMGQRNGSFHGVYFEQTGPLVVTMSESKVVLVRSLAGDSLGVHFFYGPNPKDVIEEFQNYIGKRKVPPYWAMGIHFCRGNISYSKNVTEALEEFNNFTIGAEEYEIPYDSDCISDGIFDFINHDVNSTDLEEILLASDALKLKKRVFFPTLRPHIRINENDIIYKKAVNSNILLLNPGGNGIFESTIENISVVYPDYSQSGTNQLLADFWPFGNFSNSFVLNDNWPKIEEISFNCSYQSTYSTQEVNRTLCESIPWNVVNPSTKQQYLNQHNTYGRDHANAIDKIVPSDENKFVLSSSSFTGISTGIHIQNVSSSWESLKSSFVRSSWYSIQGNLMHSIPVCGDTNVSSKLDNEKLCIKWYLSSVFMPVFRVSSNDFERHPLAFSGYAKNVLKSAFQLRYKILPYMYTTIANGSPLLRPMFYNFFEDAKTYNLDEQFMVGDAVIVAPNFRSTETSVIVYVPTNETVFDFWGGYKINTDEDSLVEIPAIENEVITLLRAGFIVPIQEKSYSTAQETRSNSNFTLIIAFDCANDENSTKCHAKGSLYVGNNAEWIFEADSTTVRITTFMENLRPQLCQNLINSEESQPISKIIDRIRLYGLETVPNVDNLHYHLITNLAIDVCNFNDNEIIEVPFI